ncbi:MAG: ParA family protein [Treponema sp.]|nr:ParA family protein [Treponema sp.]
MGRTFVFVNQKGGVGKTTSALNIGAYIASEGKNVLLVDFDAQANLSSGVGAKPPRPGIYELLSGKATIDQAIKKTGVARLDVIPASIDLSGAAVELIEQEDRNLFLKKALAPVKSRYDFILIDCPPSLGVLTLNGMAAADSVLIPMQCEYFALEGLSLLLKTVQRIQRGLNRSLGIGGIFFTMYDPRTRLAQDVVKQVSAYFKSAVFSTIIPRNIRLSEAPSHGQPIVLYDPNCAGARAYQSLAREIIRRSAVQNAKAAAAVAPAKTAPKDETHGGGA